MKAAVLHQLGSLPVFEDFPDPVPRNTDELLMTVKAASVKNIDKLRASGGHYASYTNLPVVAGIDGVGLLEDGTRVYAQALTGTIAEKALIHKNNYTVLPEKVDDATAAALPNAVVGAAMALRFRAAIQEGEVVLINGATGVTGQLAVQIAKYYGASKVIATGRNADALEKLKTLGADVTVSLKQDDEAIVKQLKEIQASTPVDIVIDYLWGHPAELMITALKGGGGLNAVSHRLRIVTVGSMAGENINLPSGVLRSSPIEISGSGFGSLSGQDFKKFNAEVLPEMFELAAGGKITIATESNTLENIGTAWQQETAPGSRMVILI